LADNPALQAALDDGGPVVPVFIHASDEEAPWQPGGVKKVRTAKKQRHKAKELA
jgi:deoxyribodipyrimidine photo-lyase